MKISMKYFIGNLLFIAILLLLSARMLSVLAGTAFPIDLVTANSMSPSLIEGDIIAWTPINIEDVEEGDVIVFRSWIHWPETKLVSHRVVEKIDSFSKPALITKGDANKYTDQAGPHIPEPYVTDKNLLGKVLSVGKQPLKIPFVGYIGLLSNNAFESLSAPSSSKGPIEYVGIFAPLTISIIVLILGIFLLPEKYGTLNEKLKFYILGSHPLNIKKIFLTFLAIYMIFFITIHAFAYDSMDASLGVGEFPDDDSFDLGTISSYSTSKPRDIPLSNYGIMPVKGFVFGNKDLSSFIDKTTFNLESGDNKFVSITATTGNVKDGVYNGDIMVFSSPFWFIFPDDMIDGLFS